ncbi:hypothetical protein NIA73_01120 [Anaerobutyricum hallii]|nr:hypothetical protein [Anaerobutyricum hallii]
MRCRKVLLEKVIPKTKHKWKLTRKRRTRYDCLKCGGVKLKMNMEAGAIIFRDGS